MRSPVFAAALPKGKTWMKIDLQKIGRSQGVDFSALMTQKPSSVLSWIQGSGDVTEVGDETVDGAATTHYRGRIDPTKIPQGAKIQKVAKAAYGPYDVWIGKDDGYVHRMRTSYSYATPAGGRQAIATTMTFSKFGEDVTVAVPAESETFDATTLSMKGLGG
jgi:hypothetical protein